MCNCGKSKNPSGNGQVVQTTAQTCEYTLIQLNALKAVATVQENSIVNSQINTYVINCNLFRSTIIPLLDFYNL